MALQICILALLLVTVLSDRIVGPLQAHVEPSARKVINTEAQHECKRMGGSLFGVRSGDMQYLNRLPAEDFWISGYNSDTYQLPSIVLEAPKSAGGMRQVVLPDQGEMLRALCEFIPIGPHYDILPFIGPTTEEQGRHRCMLRSGTVISGMNDQEMESLMQFFTFRKIYDGDYWIEDKNGNMSILHLSGCPSGSGCSSVETSVRQPTTADNTLNGVICRAPQPTPSTTVEVTPNNEPQEVGESPENIVEETQFGFWFPWSFGFNSPFWFWK